MPVASFSISWSVPDPIAIGPIAIGPQPLFLTLALEL